MSSRRDLARGSFVASMIPTKASVWCNRASIASMYPLGGPRFRDGPKKVHAIEVQVSVLPMTTKRSMNAMGKVQKGETLTSAEHDTALTGLVGTASLAFTL